MAGTLSSALKSSLSHERKLFADIAQAHAAGKHKRAEYCQMRYTTSFHARVVAADRSWRSFSLAEQLPKSAIVEVAKSVSALRGSDEPVIVRVKRKGPYGYRLVCAFGIENKCLQYLVSGALRARTVFHPRQFANSKGRPAAVLALRDALLAGNNFVAEIDIQNCYGSFNGEELGEALQLPPRLIETVVLAKNYNFQIQPISNKEIKKIKFGLAAQQTHADEDDDQWDGIDPDLDHPLLDHQAHQLPIESFLDEVRWGIPQGSCLSPLVMEALLSLAVAQIANYGVVTNYADNCALAATSEQGLATMLEISRSSFEEHPAGPLWVKPPRIYAPGDTITFLGYTLRRPKNGDVIIEPTPENLHKFSRRFKWRCRRVQKAQSHQERERRLAKLRGYVRSWTASFSLWHGAASHRNQHLGLVKKLAAGAA